MGDPEVFLIEDAHGPYVDILFRGMVYKFRRRPEDGTMWCFWWEGRLDMKVIRHLRPYAIKELGGHAPPHTDHPHTHTESVERAHPSRFIPSGYTCKKCGNQFPPGEQIPDKCPNCEESPFEE